MFYDDIQMIYVSVGNVDRLVDGVRCYLRIPQ